MTWLVKRYDSVYLGERGEQKRETKILFRTCYDLYGQENWGLLDRWKHQFGSDKKIPPQDRVTILCDTGFFSYKASHVTKWAEDKRFSFFRNLYLFLERIWLGGYYEVF